MLEQPVLLLGQRWRFINEQTKRSYWSRESIERHSRFDNSRRLGIFAPSVDASTLTVSGLFLLEAGMHQLRIHGLLQLSHMPPVALARFQTANADLPLFRWQGR